MEVINHRLGAPQAESRDEDLAAAIEGALDYLGQLVGKRFDRWMRSAAIGALGDEQFRGGHWSRVPQNGQAAPAQVAGEGDGALLAAGLNSQSDHGRAKKMAGIHE